MDRKTAIKSAWAVYALQIVPAAISFIILSLNSLFFILDDVFKIPSGSFIWSISKKISGIWPFSNDFFGTHLNSGFASQIRMYICILLYFIATVVIAILARKILSKKETTFLFLPFMVAVLAIVPGLLGADNAILIVFFAASLCIVPVQIYLPVKLKKL